MAEPNVRWPELPYKGLSPYGPTDRPLFAGRELDVELCTRLLGMRATRMLVLQGPTGSGKTSFLRAGLIPELEASRRGYFVPSDPTGEVPRSLFVRSTSHPLAELARAVFELAGGGFTFQTNTDPISVDLTEARLGCDDAITFQDGAENTPNMLVNSLVLLARRLPETLVLVVDQAEEMFTLEPGRNGQRPRDAFFDFIALLGQTPLDLKLIISLRTEYYGRFVHQMHRRNLDLTSMREYLLMDLDAEGLRQAILRPTETGPFGAPADRYRFTFEPELVQQLVDDLRHAAPQGGVLPVLQIVCGRLYQKRRPPGEPPPRWVIDRGAYEGLGRVIDLIDDYFADTLRALFARPLAGNEPEAIEAELDRWRGILLTLVRPQPDGTVTTDLKPASELDDEARKLGCLLPFGPTAEALAQEQRRILRKTEVLHYDSGKIIPCYSLGHDVLGQALRKWQNEDPNYLRLQKNVESVKRTMREQQDQINQLVMLSMSPSVFHHLAGVTILNDYKYRQGKDSDVRLLSALDDVGNIPTAGEDLKDLIIVAQVARVLHFRIFDGTGEKVVDTDEKRLTEKTEEVEKLRKDLESLWPPHELTSSEEAQVIDDVASIFDKIKDIGKLFKREFYHLKSRGFIGPPEIEFDKRLRRQNIAGKVKPTPLGLEYLKFRNKDILKDSVCMEWLDPNNPKNRANLNMENLTKLGLKMNTDGTISAS
jgi:hypothetical protein